jgi:predicted glycosyltransferase
MKSKLETVSKLYALGIEAAKFFCTETVMELTKLLKALGTLHKTTDPDPQIVAVVSARAMRADKDKSELEKPLPKIDKDFPPE